jgi:hypothetical protein
MGELPPGVSSQFATAVVVNCELTGWEAIPWEFLWATLNGIDRTDAFATWRKA